MDSRRDTRCGGRRASGSIEPARLLAGVGEGDAGRAGTTSGSGCRPLMPTSNRLGFIPPGASEPCCGPDGARSSSDTSGAAARTTAAGSVINVLRAPRVSRQMVEHLRLEREKFAQVLAGQCRWQLDPVELPGPDGGELDTDPGLLWRRPWAGGAATEGIRNLELDIFMLLVSQIDGIRQGLVPGLRRG